jgi:hypothetical protein
MKLALSLAAMLVFCTNAQAQNCNIVEPVAQTRCEITAAIQAQNIALVQKIFTTPPTSVWANINDQLACGGSGYMSCVVATKNLQMAQLLFTLGYNPNLRAVKGAPPLSYILADILGGDANFGLQLFDLYMNRSLDLNQSGNCCGVNAIFPNPTEYDLVLYYCTTGINNPAVSQNVDNMIQDAIHLNQTMGPTQIDIQFKSALSQIIAWAKAHNGSNVANCQAMLDCSTCWP